MKILYCLSNVIPLGGVDLVTCTKVNALSLVPGNQVWFAVTEKPETLPIPISDHVHLVDLEIRYNDNRRRFPWNLIVVLNKYHKHRRVLKSLLIETQPDIVISTSNELAFLTSIKGPWKIVREQHAIKKWDIIPDPPFGIKRLIYKIAVLRDRHLLCTKVDRIVVLTQEQKDLAWPNNPKVAVIPNPVRFTVKEPSPLNEQRVIAVGRLSFEKNFISLVRAWALVNSLYPGWRLDIFGKGGEYLAIKDEIDKRGLTEVVFLKGASTRIDKEMCSSSLLVLTSKYESFSMTIIEAFCCGLPVVSYACPFGPKAIITDGQNGFLVSPEDETALANRICQLIMDEDLRKRMGAMAFVSSEQYHVDRIVNQWMALFRSLLLEKAC